MKSTSLARAAAAEAIGTFALVFARAGAIMAQRRRHGSGEGSIMVKKLASAGEKVVTGSPEQLR